MSMGERVWHPVPGVNRDPCWFIGTALAVASVVGTRPAEPPFPPRCLRFAGFRGVAGEYLLAGHARARAPRDGQRTCRSPGPPAHREDVYFRTADFFGGADFFRGAAFGVGGLRASLTALPAWNRTALL